MSKTTSAMYVRQVEACDVAGNLFAVDADASSRRPSHAPSRRVRRAEFEPLKAARRFIVFQTPFSVPFTLPEAVGMIDPTIPHSKRLLAGYRKRLASTRLPASLLSPSPFTMLYGEEQIDRDPTTRGEAIALAAELNAEAVRTLGDKIVGPRQAWATIFELGQPFGAMLCGSSEGGSIATLGRSTSNPMRAINPTEQEQARYPIEWTKEPVAASRHSQGGTQNDRNRNSSRP